MKKLQRIIDNADSQTLNSARFICVLALVLIFGVVLYRHAKSPRLDERLAIAKTQTAMAVMQPQSQPQNNHEEAGGDIGIETPIINSNQNNNKENSFYANTANPVAPLMVLKDDVNDAASSESLSDFSARVLIAVDAADGSILLKKEMDKKLPIASVTKLMTAIAVLENLNSEEKIKISQTAIDTEGWVGKLIVGEEFLAIDLLRIMLVASSNDAAAAFAEHFEKKNLNLIDIMNEKAKMLGMVNTSFNNPSGLDAQNHYSTAADLARLGIYVANNQTIIKIISQKSVSIFSDNTNILHNALSTNQLLHQNVTEVIGGKTGYTKEARGCILSILNINGRKIISIVLGSEDRFEETKQIIKILKNG
ncbi:MAG: serine hydrolase [Patescibacteria group bacterium]